MLCARLLVLDIPKNKMNRSAIFYVITTVFHSAQVWGGLSAEVEPDGPRPRWTPGEAFYRASRRAVQALLPGSVKVK